MTLIRKTIENDEGFLRQVSTDNDFNTDDYIGYIQKLKEYCKNNVVYAMAAVQIGIPKRIIYLKNTSEDMENNYNSNYDESIVIINPVIIRTEGHTRYLEACESCLNYSAVVDRPYLVEIEYFDINGNIKHEVFKDFKATVFCHEYDHLNGILHLDLTDNIKIMNLEERTAYRKEHPYEILSKSSSFDLDKRKVYRRNNICYKKKD